MEWKWVGQGALMLRERQFSPERRVSLRLPTASGCWHVTLDRAFHCTVCGTEATPRIFDWPQTWLNHCPGDWSNKQF